MIDVDVLLFPPILDRGESGERGGGSVDHGVYFFSCQYAGWWR